MTATLIGFAVLFALIFLRLPIAFGLLGVGFFGLAALTNFQLAARLLGQTIRDSADSYSLTVIPLFILMGNFLTRAGLSRQLYDAAYAFLGHLRGGLAMATVTAAGAFSAVCGSSLATTATMSRVSMPSMRRYGYADSLATGSIAAGGTLGILIPPSIILVIYGILTESHIGKLFAAGLIPGILTIALYTLVVAIVTGLKPELGPRGERAAWRQRLASLAGVWGVLVLFIVVIGGIYAGFFTPTEAASVGAVFSFLFAIGRRSVTLRDIARVLVDTAVTSAALFTVLIGAMVFTQFINFSGVHNGLLAFVNGLDVPPVVVILVLGLIYLLLGCVLESLSMILLTVPVFLPIVIGLGYDPVWFGIIVVVAVEIGLVTPPIGINVFVLKSMLPDVSVGTIFRGILPFWLADITRLVLLIVFPSIALFLPNLLF